jgi:hypothetical protein
MNADFIRIAHRKAIWVELQRLLLDKYVAQDGPAKEQIICEEVPYSHKDVTNEALLEVLELIQQHECDEQLEMKQFEFKRRRPKDESREQQAAAPGAEQEPQPAAAPVGEQAPAPSPGGDGAESAKAG